MKIIIHKTTRQSATLLLLAVFCFFSNFSFAQGDYWTQRANMPGPVREFATAFSVNGKGYFGSGLISSSTVTDDFWEYNPATDVWTQMANLPVAPFLVGRGASSSFSIADKGYIGPGFGADTTPPFMGPAPQNDFWEYNPSTNVWTQKATMPGGSRQYYIGFAINGKGYFGTGDSGWPSNTYLSDFWEYDPVADTWAQKANFAGGTRNTVFGFSLLGKGYIGTGATPDTAGWIIYNDFWEYDPIADGWTQKANYPMQIADVAAFAIDSIGKGYAGTGAPAAAPPTDAFYEYDPVANTWSPRANFPQGRMGVTGFSIGNKGYFSCGRDVMGNDYNDLWEYTPPTPVGINDASVSSVSIYPNPSNGIFQINSSLQKGEVEIYSVKGEKVFSSLITNSSTTINLSTQPAGIYFVRVMAEGKSYSQKIVKE